MGPGRAPFPFSDDERDPSQHRPPTAASTPRIAAAAPADASRVDDAPPGDRGGRARRDLSAGADALPELHEPAVPGSRADEVDRLQELPRSLARHRLPPRHLGDG